MEKSRASALAALLLLVPAATLGETAALWLWPGPIGQTLYILGKVWIFALPLLWLLLVDRAPITWSRPRRGGFLAAFILGLLMAGCVIGAYLVARHNHWIDLHKMHAMIAKNHMDNLAVYLVFVLLVSTLNSLMEEYVWRWFVFKKCEVLMGKNRAVIAAALFFTLHHTSALLAYFDWRVTLLGSLGVFAGGIIWSYMYARYRSIWPGYLCHILADAGIFIVGYHLIFIAR